MIDDSQVEVIGFVSAKKNICICVMKIFLLLGVFWIFVCVLIAINC